MRKFPANLGVRGAALACCLAAFVCLGPGRAGAQLQGSLHDFQGGPHPNTLPKAGNCSSCHLPHNGQPGNKRLWTRPVSGSGQEEEFFDQTVDPNYMPSSTVLCYDCHDDGLTTETVPDPDPAIWSPLYKPQDIALGTTTKVGYYELYDQNVPGPGNPAPIDGSPTGGHYWKSEPTMTPDYERGDKIRCDLCHDPHNAKTGTNEAMFLTSTWNGTGGSVSLGDGLTASNKDDLTNPNRSRNGTGTGREMCAACHAYSNSGTPVTIANIVLPRPPTTMPQHRLLDTTACTKCHQHNKLYISCRECHGFPPLLTAAQAGGTFDKNLRPDAENYANGAGAHQRHKDALGELIFACEICHGPDGGAATWHNEGNGTVLQANVNVMGLTAYWGTTPGVGYSGVPGGVLQAGYSFTAKGANDGASGGRCYNLTCHGNPPNVALALNWTDTMVDGDTLTIAGVPVNEGGSGTFVGPTDGENICVWCHDDGDGAGTVDTTARVGTGPWAPNVAGNGTTWGAKVNGHGLAAASRYDRSAVGAADGANGAGKSCTVCHDARYRTNGTPPPANVPWKAHFDGLNDSAEKRLKGTNGTTINGQSPATADAVCLACHQTPSLPDSGTQLSHHGNDGTGGYQRLEPAFSRVCRQCHDVHGANWNGTGRNLNMVGTWVDVDNDGVADAGEEARVDSDAVDTTKSITAADNAVVFTSRTGADSFDESDTVGTQDADDVCATCHAPGTGGGAGTGGGLHDGTAGPFDMRGQDCMQCHDHDFDDVPATPDGFAPSGCEGCHGKDGIVHRGVDGVACTPDDAPNVMTVNVSGTWTSVWDGTWWDTQQGGNNAAQQGGHGDPDGKEGGTASLTPTCLACHNTSDPSSGTGRHLNGTYNSAGAELPRGSVNWACGSAQRPKGNASTNTSHLLPTYFTKYPANGAGGWSVQVAMDNFCARECHVAQTVFDMRHERDTQAADADHGAVQLGTHLTRTAPTSYLMDSDLNNTVVGAPNFAPCVACHNPHGSTNTDSKGSGPGAKNRMLIDDWQGGSTLCSNCHQ